MKKFLLFFLCLIATAIPSIAAVKTISFDTTTLNNTSTSYVTTAWEFTAEDVTYIINYVNPSSGQVQANAAPGKAFYIFNKTALGSAIQKVEVTYSAVGTTPENGYITTGTEAITQAASSSEVAGTISDKVVTYDLSSNTTNDYFRIDFSKNVKGTNKIAKIVITTAASVTAPTIEVSDDYVVTIAQADGADIYYTLDGTDPSASETPTKYTDAFTVSDDCTVKAQAKSGDEWSNVASYVIDFPIASLAEFIQKASAQARVLTCPLTVITDATPNGSTRFTVVTDGATVAILKNAGNSAFSVGDVIPAGISATYSTYSGMPILDEIANIGNVTEGGTFETPDISLEGVTIANLNLFGILRHATVSGVNNKSCTITDKEGNSLAGYNEFVLSSGFANAEDLNIVGMVGCYNTGVQFWPISILQLPGAVSCESVNPTDGAITASHGTPIRFKSEYASKLRFQVDGEDTATDVAVDESYCAEFTPDTEAEQITLIVTPIDVDGDAQPDYALTLTVKFEEAAEPEAPVIASPEAAEDGTYAIYRRDSIVLTSTNAVALGVAVNGGDETSLSLANGVFTFTPEFEEWPESFTVTATPYDNSGKAYTPATFTINVQARPAAVVTISPEAREVDYGTTVSIEGDENTASIRYSIDDGEVKEYTDAFVLTESCTVTAWGLNLDGIASEPVTAEFTVAAPLTYRLVTSTDDLKDGATYLMLATYTAKSVTSYALMGGFNSKGYYDAISLTASELPETYVYTNASVTPLVISRVKDSDEDVYVLFDTFTNQYIKAKSYNTGANVDLANTDNADEQDGSGNYLARFALSMGDKGEVEFSNGNIISYNGSSPRFKTYKNTLSGSVIYLYRLVDGTEAEPEQPDYDLDSADYTFKFSESDLLNSGIYSITSDDAEVVNGVLNAGELLTLAVAEDVNEIKGITSIVINLANPYENGNPDYAYQFSDDAIFSGTLSVGHDEVDVQPTIEGDLLKWEAAADDEMIDSFTFLNDHPVGIASIELTCDWVTPRIMSETIQGDALSFATLKGHEVKARFIKAPSAGDVKARVADATDDDDDYTAVVDGVDGWTVADTLYKYDLTKLSEGDKMEFKVINGTKTVTDYAIRTSDSVSTGIITVTADADNASATYFNLQGVRVANPTRGIYIRRIGTQAAKCILK